MVCSSCSQDKQTSEFRPSELRRLERLERSSSKGTVRIRVKRSDVLARCRTCQSEIDRKKWAKSKARGDQSYESRKAGRRAYYRSNKARHREVMVAHYLGNYEHYTFYKGKACAKKRGATQFLTFAEWKLLRSRTECHWCAMPLHQSFTNVDHIVPLCEGGQHTLDNLALSCANCNLRREWLRKVKYEQVKGI